MACQPFRHMPRVSFRSSTVVGQRWAMLPSAAGFVDPLLSTGFALTLLGIERLALILQRDLDSAGCQLQDYAEQTESDLLAASRLISALYATMDNFPAFTAVSLLYFAAVSFSETAYRLGRHELVRGFLLHRHPEFGPASRLLLELACKMDKTFAGEVLGLIEPFNLGGFGAPARRNWYPVHAEDLLDAASKLGVSEQEIVAMLDKSGFFESTASSRLTVKGLR